MRLTEKQLRRVNHRPVAGALTKTSPNSLFVDTNIIANKTSVAETFNNFLVNVGSNLPSKIPKAKNTFCKYLKKRISNSFFINAVKDNEIEKLIKNLNHNKSLGPCSIPVKILKNHANDLKQPLAFLINLSFQQGVFPEALKNARVTPIFKKDNPQIPSNYHPISVLSVFSKLYEKCMYSRLYSYLTKYKILFKKQFGCRNNYSTIHALISLVDLIKKHLDNDYFVCGISVDLQKGFDTINHDIPLAKLAHYGIRGLTNSWFSSFLKDRIQCVNLNGHCSITKQVTCGVPQGSILGPLLFLVYIECLFEIDNSLFCR